MGFSAVLDRHAKLVGRMTGTLGIDLVEAAQRGDIAEQDIRSVVFVCTGCTRTGDCVHWLDTHAEGAETAPDYCRNKALFDRLD